MFDLYQEERTMQCSVRSERCRSRQGGEVLLRQQLIVNRFAGRGPFSNRIQHQFRGVVALR